jgi:hypothetical protein
MFLMIKFIQITTSSKDPSNYNNKVNKTIIKIFKIKYNNRQEYLAHSLIMKNLRKDLMIIVITQLLMIIKTYLIINKDQQLLMV